MRHTAGPANSGWGYTCRRNLRHPFGEKLPQLGVRILKLLRLLGLGTSHATKLDLSGVNCRLQDAVPERQTCFLRAKTDLIA